MTHIDKFEPMRKIRRNPLTMTVTEKMDGSNASIHIFENPVTLAEGVIPTANLLNYTIVTASRKRWISPNDVGGKGADNYGFAHWVRERAAELVELLGPGSHFGEWCGPGIQKNRHGLNEKKFFLFNTHRWKIPSVRNPNWPDWLGVVPLLYQGGYDENQIEYIMQHFSFSTGNPEGIMVYCPEADHYRKVTFEHSEGKWKSQAA